MPLPAHPRGSRLLALALVAVFPTTGVAALDPFAGVAAVATGRLAQLRGGFEATNGLQFSFAIERAVMINGELVATTRLVLNDLLPLLTGGKPEVQLIGTVRDIVQNGLGNVVTVPSARTSAPATANTDPLVAPLAGSVSTPSVVSPVATGAPTPVTNATPVITNAVPVVTNAAPATTAGAPANTVSSSTPAPVVSAASPSPVAPGMTVERQVAGQTLVLPNATALVTTVQNTVNSQLIETRTTIDAVLSSVSALRASILADAVRRTTLDGLRRP